MITKLAILALLITPNATYPAIPTPTTVKPVEIPFSIQKLEPLPALAFKLPAVLPIAAPIYPTVSGGGNSGNTYAWGNCTWYVATNRDVPNTWGNAATWLPRAANEGYLTGTAPREGAVVWFPPGESLGHVAIVKAVRDDGSVLITEMNVKGLDVVSERVIDASKAQYIY